MDNSVGSYPWNRLDPEDIERRKREAYRAVLRQKRRKKRLLKIRLMFAGLVLFVALIITGIIFTIVKLVGMVMDNGAAQKEKAFTSIEKPLELQIDDPEPEPEPEPEQETRIYSASEEDIKGLGAEVIGQYGILVDTSEEAVLAGRGYRARMNPASMTKVLTLLVAVEHIEKSELSSPFQMVFDITNYAFVHDCSTAGFLENETVTVEDLLYGTILPSGGDAAVGLACYVAGSQEDFVVLMNRKLEELGLSETTHFTNCVGLFDEDHYSTCYDMAMIMWAAMDNELCRQVLSTKKYTTSSTPEHPEGIELSNWFLRRIEDKEKGFTVLGGKTGFVNESGNCAVSLATDPSGREHICVIAGSSSAWRCIYDHVAVYSSLFDPDYVPMTSEEAEQGIEADKAEESAENTQ